MSSPIHRTIAGLQRQLQDLKQDQANLQARGVGTSQGRTHETEIDQLNARIASLEAILQLREAEDLAADGGGGGPSSSNQGPSGTFSQTNARDWSWSLVEMLFEDVHHPILLRDLDREKADWQATAQRLQEQYEMLNALTNPNEDTQQEKAEVQRELAIAREKIHFLKGAAGRLLEYDFEGYRPGAASADLPLFEPSPGQEVLHHEGIVITPDMWAKFTQEVQSNTEEVLASLQDTITALQEQNDVEGLIQLRARLLTASELAKTTRVSPLLDPRAVVSPDRFENRTVAKKTSAVALLAAEFHPFTLAQRLARAQASSGQPASPTAQALSPQQDYKESPQEQGFLRTVQTGYDKLQSLIIELDRSINTRKTEPEDIPLSKRLGGWEAIARHRPEGVRKPPLQFLPTDPKVVLWQDCYDFRHQRFFAIDDEACKANWHAEDAIAVENVPRGDGTFINRVMIAISRHRSSEERAFLSPKNPGEMAELSQRIPISRTLGDYDAWVGIFEIDPNTLDVLSIQFGQGIIRQLHPISTSQMENLEGNVPLNDFYKLLKKSWEKVKPSSGSPSKSTKKTTRTLFSGSEFVGACTNLLYAALNYRLHAEGQLPSNWLDEYIKAKAFNQKSASSHSTLTKMMTSRAQEKKLDLKIPSGSIKDPADQTAVIQALGLSEGALSVKPFPSSGEETD